MDNVYFQQDGATFYTSNATKDILREKFPNSVISGRINRRWKPRYNDLICYGWEFRLVSNGGYQAWWFQPELSHHKGGHSTRSTYPHMNKKKLRVTCYKLESEEGKIEVRDNKKNRNRKEKKERSVQSARDFRIHGNRSDF